MCESTWYSVQQVSVNSGQNYIMCCMLRVFMPAELCSELSIFFPSSVCSRKMNGDDSALKLATSTCFSFIKGNLKLMSEYKCKFTMSCSQCVRNYEIVWTESLPVLWGRDFINSLYAINVCMELKMFQFFWPEKFWEGRRLNIKSISLHVLFSCLNK